MDKNTNNELLSEGSINNESSSHVIVESTEIKPVNEGNISNTSSIVWTKKDISLWGNILLWGKFLLWLIWVTILTGGTLYGLNYYEIKNNCNIEYNLGLDLTNDFRLFVCRELPPPRNGLSECISSIRYSCPFKPLILLYPKTTQEVSVSLKYSPWFSATFPSYSTKINGWKVTAQPDGTLFDHSTNMETYGLFWEGNAYDNHYDLSKGFVVQGSDVREFLYEKLTEIGLSTKEKSDFIMFWYPKLQEYQYVQITFAGEDYTNSAPLEISPKPDSLLRVFMVAKPLDAPIAIELQKFETFERRGFSVVEWGGTIVGEDASSDK
jgi:hypothetical protein